MSAKKTVTKKSREPSTSRIVDNQPEVALAAVTSSKKQKDVSDFMNFLRAALERNSNWLNNVVGKQTNFICAMMVGAGPNRFQLQEIIYPTKDADFKFEVEIKESEDYDKIAIAGLFRLSNLEINRMLQYIKTRLYDNPMLREDLIKGKALGISFVLLRPLSEKQFRVMERIVIGSSMKCIISPKKRREDKSLSRPPLKKVKRVA